MEDVTAVERTGPLNGIQVMEMSAIGPVPFAGMLLADLGADVIRIDRPDPGPPLPGVSAGADVFGRGKRSVVIDVKAPDGPAVALNLISRADVLLEGSRPGVMERLGLGPSECLAENPRLVYGRMTGYGQSGPLAQAAGHDINYIAISGVLARIGRSGQPPTAPLNLVGDFGGGAMFLVTGVLAALVERAVSGAGQVVDAAMVDGSAMLTAGSFGGSPAAARGHNLLDGGAPFYEVYETSDGKYLAIGAIEPKFWDALVAGLDLSDRGLDQRDRSQWARTKELIAEVIGQRTRDEWVERFRGYDACVAPVLDPDELFGHPHHQHRRSFVRVDGGSQPAPAPRLSRTPTAVRKGAPRRGEHTDEVLAALGWTTIGIQRARERGTIR